MNAASTLMLSSTARGCVDILERREQLQAEELRVAQGTHGAGSNIEPAIRRLRIKMCDVFPGSFVNRHYDSVLNSLMDPLLYFRCISVYLLDLAVITSWQPERNAKDESSLRRWFGLFEGSNNKIVTSNCFVIECWKVD